MKNIDLKDIDKDKWSDFVKDHPKGLIFQTPEMHEVFQGTKNYQPLFVGLANNKGEIIGTLSSTIQKEFGGPIGGLTARCVTWGAPLIDNNLDENTRKKALTEMLKQQEKTAKSKAIYMEFRNRWDTSKDKTTFEEAGYEYEEELEILIDVTKNEDELWSGMSKSRRKGINRAKKLELEFYEHPENESLDKFYTTIVETYDNVKVPLADVTYFSSARKILGPKNMARYFCVKKDDELLATRIVLTYKDLIFDWYAGGTEEGKRSYAGEFLVWNILLWGHENGYKTFAFGGGGKPDEDYGPREFKRRFGGLFVNYGRYKKIFKKAKMKIAMMGLKAYKKVK